jgi:hypothetical protein
LDYKSEKRGWFMGRPKKENSTPKIDMRIYLPLPLSENLQHIADYLGVPKNGAALLAMHQWTKEFIDSKWAETEDTSEDGSVIALRKNEVTGEEHAYFISKPDRFDKDELSHMAELLLKHVEYDNE